MPWKGRDVFHIAISAFWFCLTLALTISDIVYGRTDLLVGKVFLVALLFCLFLFFMLVGVPTLVVEEDD